MLENTPTLETARLVLRRFTENDVAAAYTLLSDAEVNTFLPWFPVKTPAQAFDFLRERFLSRYAAPVGYRYAICLKGEDAPIGYANKGDGDAHDFGYALRREFWGRGIATEAGTAVIDRMLADGAVPFITATHDADAPTYEGYRD